MSQVFAAQIIPAEAWLLLGTETARVLMLGAATVLHYNSGSPDTLPALTAGAVDGGGTTFDTTADNWVGYTVQGSTTLNVAKESALPSSGTFALLCYVTVHGVFLYQQPGGSGGGGGGIAPFSFNIKTANYTITTSDTGIAVDASGGAVTISLPTAIGAAQAYCIKRIDTVYANAVTIAPVVFGQTLEFLGALALVVQGHALTFGSDGANWLIASAHYPDPGTTLGDIVVIDANGVPQRLPVGADTDRVTANSAAANGLGLDYEP